MLENKLKTIKIIIEANEVDNREVEIKWVVKPEGMVPPLFSIGVLYWVLHEMRNDNLVKE